MADFAYEAFAQATIARLEEERLAVVEAKLDLELQLGRHERVIGELEELARAHPQRERPHALLMLALYRSGRHVEALEIFQAFRTRLDEELGLEPSCGAEGARASDPASTTRRSRHRSSIRPICPRRRRALVGRERELAEVAALLERDDVRLLTLTGPGGTGKTRLSLEAAAAALERRKDGVFWVSLASIPNDELVPGAVARALGVGEVPGESLTDTLRSFLASRGPLIVLDNFEHVLAAGSLVADLLAGCPDLRILVTSRTALSLYGENVYAVEPLTTEEAADLFVERAAQIGARVSADATVAAICERLDRLPLAIELAAARAKVLEPQQLLERLQVRLPLLRGGASDLPARQQTLHAAIAWSHDLLDDDERVLFRRLSVFAGSFTLEAAEAVAQAELWTLESLVGKNLVRRWGSGRLGMLETIREFAEERLEQAGEAAPMRAAHARHYLALGRALEPHLSAGERRVEAVQQLSDELDNLRAAVTEFEGSAQRAELLELATALWRFCAARGYFEEGCEWLQRGLDGEEDLPAERRARALEGLGVLHGVLHEGAVATKDALELYRSIGDDRGIAETLNNLGTFALSEGDLESAEQLFLEAEEVARRAGERTVVALATANLSAVAAERNDEVRALALLDDAARTFEQLGDAGWGAMQLITRGRILAEKGRFEDAADNLLRALAGLDDLPQREWVSFALTVGAAVSGGGGDAASAARLVGAADALLDASGAAWIWAVPADRAFRDTIFQRARESLGADSFETEYTAGRSLTLEQAAAAALAAARRWEELDVERVLTPRSSPP